MPDKSLEDSSRVDEIASSESSEASLFVKCMLGVMSALLVIGIVAVVGQGMEIKSELATINTTLKHLTKGIEALKTADDTRKDELTETKITLAALKLVLDGYTTNHRDIKAQVVIIERRIAAAEERIRALETKAGSE